MAKKIFITGCAKSGTTLLLRMCFAFKDAEVLYRKGAEGHELEFNEFVKYKSDQKFVIGKRHPPAILSTIWNRSFDYQIAKVVGRDIGIINVVRDGRDVVLSDGNYVKPNRWINCIEQRNSDYFKNIISLEVSYEDLVRNSNKVQKKIEKTFGIKSKNKFSEYPDYVEDWVFDWNVSVLARAGKGNEKGYGKRKVSDKSIGKDIEAYKSICTDDELPVFERHLKELGYL